jgi:hypothetical protein
MIYKITKISENVYSGDVMIKFNAENSDKYVNQRERLIQTFFILSGFFVSNNPEQKSQGIVVSLFSITLVLMLLYYIVISRVELSHREESRIIDILAYFSAASFSAFLVVFLNLTIGFEFYVIFFMLFAFITIFTISLMSPLTIDRIFISFIKLIVVLVVRIVHFLIPFGFFKK